jgi:hypothetical protein
MDLYIESPSTPKPRRVVMTTESKVPEDIVYKKNYVRRFESAKSLASSGQTKYAIKCPLHEEAGVTVRSIREYQLTYSERFHWDSISTRFHQGSNVKHKVPSKAYGVVQDSWIWGFFGESTYSGSEYVNDESLDWGTPWTATEWNSESKQPESRDEYYERFVPFNKGAINGEQTKEPVPLEWQVAVVVWTIGNKKHKRQSLLIHRASELTKSSWNVYYL